MSESKLPLAEERRLAAWLRPLVASHEILAPASVLLLVLVSLASLEWNPLGRFLLALAGGALLAWLLVAVSRRIGQHSTELRAAQDLIERLAREHWVFLTESNRALAASLDLEETLKRVARLPVPVLADHCRIHLLQPSGAWHTVCHDRESEGILRVEEPPGEAVLRVHASRTAEILNASRELVIPMEARGTMVGALALGFAPESTRRYGDSDMAMAGHVASRFALALDNARLYEDLRGAIRGREDLLAVISHELKNALAVVDVYASLALRHMNPTDMAGLVQRDHLDKIQGAKERMSRLIQDLLDLEKMKSGSFEPRRQPESAVQLIRTTVESIEAIASRKAVSIMQIYPDHDRLFNLDRDGIFRVMTNLLMNAVKFVQEGGELRVTVSFEERNLLIRVADNGPGIDAHELPYVFDRFWQTKSAANLGSGLGLAISRGIVHAHGGSIRAESVPGRGAVFTVTLPSGN